MIVDAAVLERILRTPRRTPVERGPIVQLVVLDDPANIALLVPALAEPGTLGQRNAFAVLCRYGAVGVAPLLQSLQGAGFATRRAGLDVLWAMLAKEPQRTIGATLQAVKPLLFGLLDDGTLIPDDRPAHVERDFPARLCDLAYVYIGLLRSRRFEQSLFRVQTRDERDRAIARLKARDLSLVLQ